MEPQSLAFTAAAVTVVVVWRLAARRLPQPELPFLAPLGRLAPWVPRLLGIHLGVSLLSLAVQDAYLAPHLSLEPVPGGFAIALAEGLIGVWLITGVHLRAPALAVVALGPLALVIAGPVAMLEAADLLGVALFLVILPPGPDRFGAAVPERDQARNAIFFLKLFTGVALIVVSFSEKLANPELASEFLDAYPAFNLAATLGLDIPPETFIRFAGAVELGFGLLFISGAAPQIVVIAAGIPFNATLFFLGRNELIGHLPIYGAMLALLVYGSARALAREVPKLTPELRR